MNGAELTIVGNATREPELRYTTGGRGVASFGVAVGRRYQKDGEWQEDTIFFDVNAWADLGEHVAQSVTKGTRVIVQGRLQQREWEADDGTKRSKMEVVAEAVGVELRWATASVTKTTRSQGERAPHPADTADDTPASPGSSGGRSGPLPDEEPFVVPADIGDV